MANKVKQIHTIIAFISLLWVTLPTYAETYVYVEKDGTRWITDHKLPSHKYTFVDKYGRSTAHSSCKNVTKAIMARRAKKYISQIKYHAAQYQIDPQLIKAMITVESCFDEQAISKAGARGLMQLMPETAKNYGLYDRFNADANIRVGITHFNKLLKYFNHDIKLSLAAYNAGINAVKKYKGIPPYKETQRYVRKIMRYYRSYKSEILSSTK